MCPNANCIANLVLGTPQIGGPGVEARARARARARTYIPKLVIDALTGGSAISMHIYSTENDVDVYMQWSRNGGGHGPSNFAQGWGGGGATGAP